MISASKYWIHIICNIMNVVKIDVSRCGIIAPDAIQGIALDLNPKILYGFPIKLVIFTLR